MKVQFNEELHEYTDEIGKYISVTQLIGKYKQPFNRLPTAEKYIKDHPEYPMSLEQCLYAWDFLCDFALDKGNKYHNRKELEALWGHTLLEKGYVEQLESLINLPDNVYPELRVYNEKYRLAGHIDRVDVFTMNGEKWVDIEDYKTYKDSVSKKGFKGAMMFPPIQNLPDANYYHAGLQLNIYAFLLEEFGYKIRNLKLHHKQFDDDEPIPEKYITPFADEEELRNPIIYEIKYSRKLVLKLINHYVQNN